MKRDKAKVELKQEFKSIWKQAAPWDLWYLFVTGCNFVQCPSFVDTEHSGGDQMEDHLVRPPYNPVHSIYNLITPLAPLFNFFFFIFGSTASRT